MTSMKEILGVFVLAVRDWALTENAARKLEKLRAVVGLIREHHLLFDKRADRVVRLYRVPVAGFTCAS